MLRRVVSALLRVIRLALLGLRTFLRALNRALLVVTLPIALLMTAIIRRAVVARGIPAVFSTGGTLRSVCPHLTLQFNELLLQVGDSTTLVGLC